MWVYGAWGWQMQRLFCFFTEMKETRQRGGVQQLRRGGRWGISCWTKHVVRPWWHMWWWRHCCSKLNGSMRLTDCKLPVPFKVPYISSLIFNVLPITYVKDYYCLSDSGQNQSNNTSHSHSLIFFHSSRESLKIRLHKKECWPLSSIGVILLAHELIEVNKLNISHHVSRNCTQYGEIMIPVAPPLLWMESNQEWQKESSTTASLCEAELMAPT